MWSLHDRLDEYITEESCKLEIDSFRKHGQLVPVLGRPVRNDSSYEAELIYGARRLFIARHLNVPLKVDMRELSDTEAIVAMDIENRQRKDISPYERALSYARWLREKRFRSQEELARVLCISASQVSRLLQLTKLPTIVIGAFGRPMDICEVWGLDLARACEDPQTRESVVRHARAIAQSGARMSATEVYERLIAATSPDRKARRESGHDEVVKSSDGEPLFRIRSHRRGVALLLPKGRASRQAMQSIRTAVAEILENAKPNPVHTGEPIASP
jgi:ParB family chromosome partitioning protein